MKRKYSALKERNKLMKNSLNKFWINISPFQGLDTMAILPQCFALCYNIMHFQCNEITVETGFPWLPKEV
jgi:hypothetical protein